jgi:UDP-GlcNAc:undecaprenyl-phosphate/decaprenyl-phosphate GlcNAc-1-phosphate transferase
VREYEYFLTLLVTAAVTYLLTPLVRRAAIRIKAVPPTRDRDVHAEPIPRMGGLAMYFGVAAGLIVASQLAPFRAVLGGTGIVSGLLLAGGLIVVIGIIDDRWGLSAIGKLAGQVAAASVLVASGAQLSSFPLPKEGVFELTYHEGVVVTILVVVATINAVNFIDGLDGLAAGIVCIAAFSFFLYYYSLTKFAAPHIALPAEAVPALASIVLAGACIGFLPHNFYPARIFMGDTGSMLLGLLLAYVPISAISSLDFTNLASRANRYAEILPLLLPAAVMAIPYTDMLRAVIRRTRAGQSPFAADRKHLHHRMLEVGHSHRSSVLILYAWAALFAGTVVGLSIVTAPLVVLAGITLAAVLVLVLLSMPRLRWWERRRGSAPARQPAVAGTAPAAPAPASAPAVAPAQSPAPAPPPAQLPAPGPAAVYAAPVSRHSASGGAAPGAATPGPAPRYPRFVPASAASRPRPRHSAGLHDEDKDQAPHPATNGDDPAGRTTRSGAHRARQPEPKAPGFDRPGGAYGVPYGARDAAAAAPPQGGSADPQVGPAAEDGPAPPNGAHVPGGSRVPGSPTYPDGAGHQDGTGHQDGSGHQDGTGPTPVTRASGSIIP